MKYQEKKQKMKINKLLFLSFLVFTTNVFADFTITINKNKKILNVKKIIEKQLISGYENPYFETINVVTQHPQTNEIKIEKMFIGVKYGIKQLKQNEYVLVIKYIDDSKNNYGNTENQLTGKEKINKNIVINSAQKVQPLSFEEISKKIILTM